MAPSLTCTIPDGVSGPPLAPSAHLLEMMSGILPCVRAHDPVNSVGDAGQIPLEPVPDDLVSALSGGVGLDEWLSERTSPSLAQCTGRPVGAT